MQTQKELVRLHPRHGLLNIDVLSFKRLAYRVFEDLGVQLPVVLDDMGKSMVIRKVAGKLKKDLNLPVFLLKGFCPSLLPPFPDLPH